MIDEIEIKTGDEALIDGSWYTITRVMVEIVPTKNKGNLKFTRLYFGDDHKPQYTYEVQDVRHKV